MSTETEHTTESEKSDDEHVHEHPSDKKYFQIAGVLAVLTALEVATYWLESMPGEILIPLLMIMMTSLKITKENFENYKSKRQKKN